MVVVAVVVADVGAGGEAGGVVEASFVGAVSALASTITVRVLVDVLPQVSVAT